MQSYSIYGHIEELEDLVKGFPLGEKALRKAMVSSLNKSIVSTRSFAAKLIAKEYRITQKAIKAELPISKAHFNRLEARILGEGSPGIPLFQFAPLPKEAPSTKRTSKGGYKPKKGIKVMIHRGDRKVVKGAFIARMASGHVGVFKRKGRGLGAWWNAFKAKGTIEELYGPSPLRILDSDTYQIPIDDFAGDALEKNIAHEAQFYLRKYKVIPHA